MKEEKELRFFKYLFGFDKIKTRWQWLTIISVHVLVWILFFTVPLFFFPIRINDNYFYIKEAINKLCLITFFYIHYFYFIPRYFIPAKYSAYTLLLLLSLVVLIGQHFVVERYWFPNNNIPGMIGAQRLAVTGAAVGTSSISTQAGQTAGVRSPFFSLNSSPRFGLKGVLLMTTSRVFFSFLLLILLSGFIRLFQQFITTQNEKKGLENAGLLAELNLLKSQINPHFLFNTLNSIYAQAYQKSENTEKSILKLSEILRYMIYDTAAETISLRKDIHYINSYIDLQRLRLPGKIIIDYTVDGILTGIDIAPLLLITFIENAFKHGISYTQASHIKITIAVLNKNLSMVVCNPIVDGLRAIRNGIGLKNARRRLELLYPGRYSLNILEDNSLYIVNLFINLAIHELPDHR